MMMVNDLFYVEELFGLILLIYEINLDVLIL